MNTSTPPAPIAEEDIAAFLVHNPGFFERHPDLLSSVRLGSAHGQRVVNLQERQAEMLRDKIRQHERRLIEMMRNGSDNAVTTNRLFQWAASLMLEHRPEALPKAICEGIASLFTVPQVAMRAWDVLPPFADAPFATGASKETRSFASSLSSPYCGMHVGVEAVKWLEQPTQAASLALIALRKPDEPLSTGAFGLLVLASPDPHRYQDDMATDFLERIGILASAALSRITPSSAAAAAAL